MRRFADLSPSQAQQAFAEFLSERPRALAYLCARLAADGIDPADLLDGSVGSLDPLLEWIKRQLHPPPKEPWKTAVDRSAGVAVPAWYRHEIDEEPLLAPPAVRLVDGLLSYVADVVIAAAPGTGWAIGHESFARYIDENAPVLRRGGTQVGAVRMVFGIARGLAADPNSHPQNSLRQVAARWIESLVGAEPVTSESSPPLEEVSEAEVVVGPGDEEDESVVGLYDDVRLLVGDAAIERLAQTLPGNLGTSEAAFEDREVLVVRGRVDRAELKRWIVAQLAQNAPGSGDD